LTDLSLVLSGGGARGAYEVGVLSYVFRDLVRRHGRPIPIGFVCGTSVGAVNGTYFASVADEPDSGLRELEALWHSLTLQDVLRFGPRQVALLPSVLLGGTRANGIFDSQALAELAAKGLSWRRLRGNLDRGIVRALTITTTQVTTGRPVVFVDRSPSTPLPPSLARRAVVRADRIRLSHVLASAAIPLVFPPVPIDGQLHCDGGLRLNTPMAPAIHLGAEKILAIGVSSPAPAVGLPSLPPGVFPGAPFLLGKVLNAFLLDHLAMDLVELDRINQFLRDGTALYGPGFLEQMNERAASRGEPRRRPVDYLAVRPSIDLGRVAAEHIRSHRVRFGRILGRTLLKLLDMGEGADADLASYLMFDGTYAKKLIDLGRADAHARRDELGEFLFGAAGAREVSRA
jgi:NTE family protein